MPATPEVGVNFRVHGLDPVRRGLKMVADEAEPTARKWGASSRQIAGSLESVARQGRFTGESLKQVLTQGAEMAFLFGAGGAVVGAVAITGMAIYEHITGNIKKAREEARAFQSEIAGIRRDGNLTGAGDIAKRLYSGDRYAVQADGEDPREFEARSLGVQGLRVKVDILKNRPQFGKFGNPGQREDLAKYTALLKQYEERARAAAGAVNDLAIAEGRRVAVGAGLNMAEINKRQFGDGPVNPYAGRGDPIAMLLDDIVGAKGLRPRPLNFGIVTRAPNLLNGAGNSAASVAMVDGMKNAAEIAGRGFVDTLASTIETGMARVFEKGANAGTIFASIADTALSGLGGIAVQIGRAALTQFAFIKSISSAIASMNPAIGIPAAIGLIAFGSALGGAGHRIAANAAGGGGAYAAASGYGGSIVDRGIIDPTRGGGNVSANRAVVVNATIIGPNDPIAQRQLQELIRNAGGRGGVGG